MTRRQRAGLRTDDGRRFQVLARGCISNVDVTLMWDRLTGERRFVSMLTLRKAIEQCPVAASTSVNAHLARVLARAWRSLG